MSNQQNKWDNTYRDADYSKLEVSAVLKRNQHLLPSSGRAVDLACGLGANAICLAASGLVTEAWDFSSVALTQLEHYARIHQLDITTQQRDIEQHPPSVNRFDVVIVTHFLYRPIFPAVLASLKPGGLLYYQTFTRSKTSHVGPSNPNYLLAENELLNLCVGLKVLYYREEGQQGNWQAGWRNQAMIVAKKT